MLPTHARDQLRIAATPNFAADLDTIIAGLRASYPKHFHDINTLASRVFVHKPVGDVPHARFVTSADCPGRAEALALHTQSRTKRD